MAEDSTMAASGRSGSTSPFDEMLEQNQRELDALYSGPVSGNRTPSITEEAPSRAPTGTDPLAPQSSPAQPRPGAGAAASDAVRFLNDRYGGKWRHDVVDRRREGDEIIVLCKLTIEEGDITKSQFGSARIGGGRQSKIAGSAGGVSFSVAAGGSADTSASPDSPNSEDAAFDRAVNAALANCVTLL